MRARRLPPLLVPLAAIVLLSATFLVVRNSEKTWDSLQQVAQQGLTEAEERLNEVGGKVLDTASSLADNPAPAESPTPTQIVVFAEPSVEDQAVRVALAAQETPMAELVIAPTTVSTSTTDLTVTASVTSTTPITAQAVALADVQPGAALELEVSPTATQEPAPTEAPTDTPAPAPTPAIAPATATRAGSAAATNKQTAPSATPVQPTATPTATRIPPTATATPLPPTATPTATPVPPTATATPLPPTATPRATSAASLAEESTYTVVSGDNWYSIARRLGITQEALAAANGTTPSDILQVDQILRIPPAGSGPTRPSQAAAKSTAAATQTATVVAQTYTVQRGDNWFSIAKRFGATQEALAAYNGRSPNDILQVNQKLRIPPAGVVVAKLTPTSEPTKAVKPSPTPTPEPTLAPEPPAVVKLPAPVLLAPGNDDGFSADTLPVLTWQPVTGINAGDYYHVVVRFALKNGEMGFVLGETTDASFTVPRWVFDQAQTPDRIGRWSVQVRRLGPAGDAIEASPPSETRSFYWR